MSQKSISDFPLKWRWTDEKYDKLPDEHLARIIPADTELAKNLWKRSLRFSDKETEFCPLKEIFHSVNIFESPHSDEKTEIWIRNRFETNDLESIKVWVSWQPDLAIKTDMEIIARYWDTFCYEASDDTSIFPETEEWVIHFLHEDRLYYATSSEQSIRADGV